MGQDTMLKYCQMTFEQIIGARIRQLRKRNEWSMAELGRRAGTTHGHISLIERGAVIARIDVIARIARVLKVSVDYLIGQANIADEEGMENRELTMIREDTPSYGSEKAMELIAEYAPDLNYEYAKEMLMLFDRIPPDKQARAIAIIQELFIKWPRLDASTDGSTPGDTRLKG